MATTNTKVRIECTGGVQAREMKDGSWFVIHGHLYLTTYCANVGHVKAVCVSEGRPWERMISDDVIVQPVDVEIRCTPIAVKQREESRDGTE